MRARASTSVLITGFGPFPGIPHNLSSGLVPRLAALARTRFPTTRIVTAVLPVSWSRAPLHLARLVSRHRPILTLHFGVSAKATGFVIESVGHNRTAPRPDCGSASARAPLLVRHGPSSHAVTIPASRIVRRLTRLGYPSELSCDAGDYLCNAVLYHALALDGRQSGERHASGFVHIPADLSQSLLDWPRLLAGSLEILRVSLTAAAAP